MLRHHILEMIIAGEPVTPPGQVIFTSNASWTVPTGVYAISMCAIQGGGSYSMSSASIPAAAASVTVGGVIVCRAVRFGRIGQGGGDGGNAGLSGRAVRGTAPSSLYEEGGGGGAGGYNGNGGDGGDSDWTYTDKEYTYWYGKNGTAGSGAAGGGMCGVPEPENSAGQPGAGTGLKGIAATGLGGRNTYGVPGSRVLPTGGSNGASPSGSNPGLYGGGPVSGYNQRVNDRGYAGSLSWQNDIAVTPGQVVTIAASGNGGVRIMWGPGRSYPNNAGDV